MAAASTNNIARIENKKYRMLLNDSIRRKGHKLYRIQYKVEIRDKDDNVIVSIGYLGGYIESLDNLSEKGGCAIGNNVKVWENARVYEDAVIWGVVNIYGDARVYEDAQVYGDARVYEDAWVYGDAQVYGKSHVYGDARICGGDWSSELPMS